MTNNNVTILILTCGTNACFHVSKRLKECFGARIRIVGADINKEWMIPTKPYLDSFYQCPYTSDSSYYQFVLSICERENVDFILPSFDADQNLFYDGKPDLERLGIRSFGISTELIETYRTKENTNRFLESKGLPIPVMYKKDEIVKEQYYFCKPRTGIGSIGTRIMKGIDILNSDESELLIEEFCTGPEITLECFNYSGKVYSVARERLDTKSGVCTKARVYYDASLESIAQKFAEIIKLPYIFNLQFMTNSRGEKVITDVNMRTAGGMSLSYAAGWDEVEALGKIMLGEDNVVSTVNVPIKEQYVIRAYTDIVTRQIKKRIAFDLDGTLLNSRKRHKIVMDFVLTENGIDIDTSDYLGYKYEGNNNISWLTYKGISEKSAAEINKRWIELIEDEQFLAEDDLYKGTISLLNEFSKDNFLVLLTARNNQEGLNKQISGLGIKQYFDKIIVIETSKKTPELKSNVLKEMHIDEFYGDTESDMKAAIEAGCDFYVSTRGFRSKQFWSRYDVKYTSLFADEV